MRGRTAGGNRERAALRALDDTFTISDADGETAVVEGEMEVEIVRFTSDGVDQFRLRFNFPAVKHSTFGSRALSCCSSLMSKRTSPTGNLNSQEHAR